MNCIRKSYEMSLSESNVSQWHEYSLNERHAAWKVFLPASAEKPILAVGLRGSDLASLGRSWKVVHVYQCNDRDLDWAAEQARILGRNYRFERIKSLATTNMTYPAIAVSAEFKNICQPVMTLRLLEPGGSAVWVGKRSQLPSVSQLLQQGYQYVSNYALLPPKTGLLLIPLINSKSTRVGLNLYKPGKWQNRLAVRILQTALTFRFEKLLVGIKQVVVGRKPGLLPEGAYLLDSLAERIGFSVVDATVFSGWLYLILQLLDDKASVVGVAKIADMHLGSEAIGCEIITLKWLKNFPEIQDYLPELIATGDWYGHTYQIQKNVAYKYNRFENKLSSAHVKFLSILSRIDRCQMTLEQWPYWSELWRWAHARNFTSPKEQEIVCRAVERSAQMLKNKKLHFHRIHGDFTPPNVILSPDGLKVIDWSESDPMGLPFYDVIYFKLFTHRLKTCVSSEKLLMDPLSFLGIDNDISCLAAYIDNPKELATLAAIAWVKCISDRILK